MTSGILAPSSTGVTITNPLVLYRTLVATQKLRADPAQHRLAIHLQKLYERLKDYEPAVEYSHKLKQLNQILGPPTTSSSTSAENDTATTPFPEKRSSTKQMRQIPQYTRIGRGRALLNSWLASTAQQKQERDTLALTRALTDHDAAMEVNAPRGLLLHGSVGTGKSMLVDLFAECLPTKRKRRWHYNTFMLNVVSRLETLRKQRLVDDEQRRRALLAGIGASGDGLLQQPNDAHALLWLARELATTSPILFLDEFQLPDRMAAKTLSGLLTCFFRLGGVLIATSNRLPDELAKAAGMEYAVPSAMGGGFLSAWMGGITGKSERMFAGLGEYADFLELLKKRCEVWEMEGKSDYRRDGKVKETNDVDSDVVTVAIDITSEAQIEDEKQGTSQSHPPRYLLSPSTDARLNAPGVKDLISAALPRSDPIDWRPASAIVYGRTIPIPRAHNGIAAWTFDEICAAQLGPADYITLASMFHTFIITSIPILTTSLKNEARRFITLLDALYEARCKLAISAAVPPDDLFFPDLRARKDGQNGSAAYLADDMQAETFSEIHQDLTVPFRPNISSYKEAVTHEEHEYQFRADALEDDPPNKMRRAALGEDMTEHQRMESLGRWRNRVDFGRTGAFVGEDETFAWKRATSRIWEMCGDNWWAKEDWWRPLRADMRHWEGRANVAVDPSIEPVIAQSVPKGASESVGVARDVSKEEDEPLFRHGASPFRTHDDPPPRIQPEHVWGIARWGKRAGSWGEGVEGLQNRKKDNT